MRRTNQAPEKNRLQRRGESRKLTADRQACENTESDRTGTAKVGKGLKIVANAIAKSVRQVLGVAHCVPRPRGALRGTEAKNNVGGLL